MRTLKDAVSYCVNEFHDDWDLYLSLIAYQYNTTVNDATGFTPFALMFGREASAGTAEFETTPIRGGPTAYATQLSRAQRHAWNITSARLSTNNETHNKKQAPPRNPLQFKPYAVNDWFYIKVVPRTMFRNAREETTHKLTAKFQFRYAGPYVITKVISPVLYEAIIHGKPNQRVHAINMKHA